MTGRGETVVVCHELRKAFRRQTGETVQALDGVSFKAQRGTLTALVGPDGAGKTTLLRLLAGLFSIDAGEVHVLGIDVRAEPERVQPHLGYMPQRFGLYEDLTVQENFDLYADVHGVTAAARRERYEQLMQMTNLGPFRERLAGRLSGGMKQKLGLACALVRTPDLLLLDEPTVGVDPLSRRELWEIILQLVGEQQITVLVSTSYLDEAERCDRAVVLYQGKILAQGAPGEVSALAEGRTFCVDPPAGQTARGLQARLLAEANVIDAVPEGGQVRFVCKAEAGQCRAPAIAALAGAKVATAEPRFEDGFMVLLREQHPEARERHDDFNLGGDTGAAKATTAAERGEAVVEVHDLVRQFGQFTAVDHINFEVHHNEIFGLLGPNGAGKTTTFRMLCGLLPATAGTLRVAGVDLGRARASARKNIGYVAQKFSLYGQLTVLENLDFFAAAYGVRGERRRRRIAWALEEFELEQLARLPSEQLPGGYKQRLAMAAALLHEPEILFLDEPTSGADPAARREFWLRITALAEHGVTVIVTTHFMEEAEYCDRVVILDAGRILAQGTPAEVRRLGRAKAGRNATMEDAFIAVVEQARQHKPQEPAA
ncbi:MAG TPA: ATP-binding cassette domain-containing protein [Pirellulales bacterium]|jgi:ABC-2 type transport system ATP-binding protein|nr:ATP-binding cassette domain-containing protein [Pirellulales bacterium]